MKTEIIESAGKDLTALTTKELIKNFGGWIEGHIVFENGEHGNGYIDNLQFLRYPRVMDEIGRRIAAQFSNQKDIIDAVVGPSIIGAILAYAVTRHLDIPFTTTYHEYGFRQLTFHRGFIPPKESRCLFIDDLVFSGRSASESIAFLQNQELTVVGISVIGSRKNITFPVPFRSLFSIEFTKSVTKEYDLCKDSIPITYTNIRE